MLQAPQGMTLPHLSRFSEQSLLTLTVASGFPNYQLSALSVSPFSIRAGVMFLWLTCSLKCVRQHRT